MSGLPTTTPKRVLLAAPRGYCAGVDRAVVTVEKALELYGAPVYVRKEIVHNKHVVTTLRKRGAIFVDETDEVPEGATVIFSAHGVAPVVHDEARARSLKTIDATCPLVTKVHREAVRFADADFDILLIGHEGHEEVVGTAGEAPEHITLVDGPDDVVNVQVRDPEKVVWLSQTTLSVDETMETVRRLRERFPKLQDPPSDDICYATQNRQVAVKQMAPDCDLVLVVGSRNSSNSVRLVEVALDHGAQAGERREEPLARVDRHEPHAGRRHVVLLDLLALLRPEQAVVDEDADQLVPDRLVHEGSSNSRVDPARETADHATRAHLRADALDLLGDDVAAVPVGRDAGGPVKEVLQHRLPVRRVLHLGVPLDSVELARVARECGDRGRVARGEHLESLGRAHDRIAVGTSMPSARRAAPPGTPSRGPSGGSASTRIRVRRSSPPHHRAAAP